MKINLNSVKIFGTENRPVTAVDLNSLRGVGGVFEGYSMRKGEVIEFPDEPTVGTQPVREGQDAVAYLVTCKRNGVDSVFSLGSLNKRDINGKYTCTVTEQFGPLDNFDKVQKLAGHKLICNEMKTITVQRFDRAGNMLEGQTREQNVPVFIYE